MAIVIICVIIGAIIGYISWSEFGDSVLYGLVGLVIGLGIYFIVGGFIGCGLATNEVVEEQKIYALNDITPSYLQIVFN